MPLELKDFADAFALMDAQGKMQPGAKLAKPAITALITNAGFNYRSVPKAAEGVLALAEDECSRRLQLRVVSDISDILRGHAGIYGTRDVAADVAQWDADIEESFEDYAGGTIREGIGVDGIGEAMTRLDLNMPEWSQELVKRFVAGAIAGLIRDKTPAKVLSSIGIVKSDLEALVVALADDNIDDVGSYDPSKALFVVVNALREFAKTMGAADTETLAAFCGGWDHINEQLWSTEPALRASALTALGAVNIAPALEAVINNKVSVSDVFTAVFSADPAPGVAKKPSRKKRAAKDVALGPWNEIAANLRTLLPGKDGEKADALGMSRSAFGLYATSKRGWEADQAEYEAALALIDSAASGLAEIRSMVEQNVPL